MEPSLPLADTSLAHATVQGDSSPPSALAQPREDPVRPVLDDVGGHGTAIRNGADVQVTELEAMQLHVEALGAGDAQRMR